MFKLCFNDFNRRAFYLDRERTTRSGHIAVGGVKGPCARGTHRKNNHVLFSVAVQFR